MKISYTFKESFKNLWRNRLMSLASITSVSATLLILGIIFILVMNINNFSQGAKDQFKTIQIYLNEGIEEQEIDTLENNINQLEGVTSVEYESKEDALVNMKESWGDNGYLLNGLEENPLPNSIIIDLGNIEYADYVVNNVNEMEGVDEVKYYRDIINKIISITNYIRNIGLIIIFVLIAISTFIISNTIKLALNARRREINIMKYVGATNWFIRWPFILEGTILGLIGALISTGIIYYAYQYTYKLLTSEFYVIIAAYIVNVSKVLDDTLILFVVIGCGIGALGSITSLRKHLDV